MFSSLQFIYYYYLIFVVCHSNCCARAVYNMYILHTLVLYNYWAYLKVLQYAEEILRLAKVSLLCQGCGNFGNKPDALPSMRPGVFLHSRVQENEPAGGATMPHPVRAFGTAATDLPILHFRIR